MSTVINVFDKEIPVKQEKRDIHELSFWKENPRVNSLLKRKYGSIEVSDLQVEDTLTDEEHVRALFQQIKKHGGLIDEILVMDDVALEGNSRLCAYRMLYKKAEKDQNEDLMAKWKYIPCKVLPSNTSDEAIFTILGTYHIDGKTQWDTFEKAAFLKRMKVEYNYTSDRIAEIINESKSFVDNNIEAHDLMIEHNVYELDKFSYFIELVKNRGIKEATEKDTSVRVHIINAVKNDQFVRANQIRDVHKVLKDKVAKRQFIDDGENFEDAFETAKERNPQFDNSFYSHLKKTTDKLNKLDDKQAEKIEQEVQSDSNKKDIVRRFTRAVNKFYKKVGSPK